MRELGFTSWFSKNTPLDSALTRLAAAGCSVTEVAAMPSYLDRASVIQRTVEGLGMQVATVSLGPPFFYSGSALDLHSPKAEVRSHSRRYVRRAIDFSSVLGARIVYVCSMSKGSRARRPQTIGYLKEAITDCSDYSKSRGIRFAIEPFPTGELSSVAETNELILEMRVSNLGIVYDSGHAAISGENLSEAARTSEGRIVHVHLNNNDGLRDLHWPLERGTLTRGDFAGLIRELDRQGYAGMMSVELTKPGRVVGAVEASRKFIEGL